MHNMDKDHQTWNIIKAILNILFSITASWQLVENNNSRCSGERFSAQEASLSGEVYLDGYALHRNIFVNLKS